jgi:hypothetical protein
MEHEQCLRAAEDYVQEQYVKEDRRIQKRDKLIAYLNACDAASALAVVEIIRSGRSQLPNKNEMKKARLEYGYPYTHGNVKKHASLHSITCLDPADIFRSLGY